LRLEPSALLNAEHLLDGFACGTPTLDDWLKRRARANQIGGASRTYVVVGRVVGYYCLASGALALNDAPGGLKRNMSDPIPMAIIGRLGVDQSWQSRGLGHALLRDAVERTQSASAILGIRGLLVHGADDVGDVVDGEMSRRQCLIGVL